MDTNNLYNVCIYYTIKLNFVINKKNVQHKFEYYTISW